MNLLNPIHAFVEKAATLFRRRIDPAFKFERNEVAPFLELDREALITAQLVCHLDGSLSCLEMAALTSDAPTIGFQIPPLRT